MSMELIAIIGASVTIISASIALASLILNSQRAQREETQAQFKTMRAELQAHQEETRAEFKSVRAENQTEFKAMQAQMQAHREENQAEFKAVRAELQTQWKETQAEFKITREAIGELRERMAHLEGLVEGLTDALTGRRVAEEPGDYGTN